jgi:hypothetical protein
MRIAYIIVVGKPEEKRSLGRPRRRWDESFRMGLWEIRWEAVGCMHLDQDSDHWWAVVTTGMNLLFP